MRNWLTWVATRVRMAGAKRDHVSVDVLDNMPSALRLTPNERRHLFTLAEQTLPANDPPFEERSADYWAFC